MERPLHNFAVEGGGPCAAKAHSHLLVQYSCCCGIFWKKNRLGHMLQGPQDFSWVIFLQARDGAPQRSGP